MRIITCDGSPFETGFKHGREARQEILRSLYFYKEFFLSFVKLSWHEACGIAERFLPTLEKGWPDYVEEMRGVAAGSNVPFSSILVLNVRSEIAFGDGCTALSWKDGNTSILAQNWDWQHEQKENLICLHIDRHGKPSIEMITEGGIIGKIGLNSAGVGVCLNAIRARGIDFTRLPCHLALRMCLDSNSREEAVVALQRAGVASSCHILIADAGGGTGLECSSIDVVEIPMTSEGLVVHTNHYVKEHPRVEEITFLEDSEARLAKISMLARVSESPDVKSVQLMLEDEEGYPTAINRQRTEETSIETLFSIVMDPGSVTADVRTGRPSEVEDKLKFQPNNRDEGGASWVLF